MKHFLIACLAGTALMACTPSTAPTPETRPTVSGEAGVSGPVAEAPATEPSAPPAVDPAAPPADTCNAASHAALVGKPVASPGVPAEGPGVRYIRPNTQVTMDFRADRLNIHIDGTETITEFRCG